MTPVGPTPPRPRPGGGRALRTLLLAAALVGLVALGVARLVGWGTPVAPPVIPPPPAAPAPR